MKTISIDSNDEYITLLKFAEFLAGLGLKEAWDLFDQIEEEFGDEWSLCGNCETAKCQCRCYDDGPYYERDYEPDDDVYDNNSTDTGKTSSSPVEDKGD